MFLHLRPRQHTSCHPLCSSRASHQNGTLVACRCCDDPQSTYSTPRNEKRHYTGTDYKVCLVLEFLLSQHLRVYFQSDKFNTAPAGCENKKAGRGDPYPVFYTSVLAPEHHSLQLFDPCLSSHLTALYVMYVMFPLRCAFDDLQGGCGVSDETAACAAGPVHQL